MPGPDDLIRVARSQIGTTESPAGSNISKYGRAYGWVGVPWCSIFAWWCFREAGLGDLYPHTASVAVVYDYARREGRLIREPRVGAVPLFDFAGGQKFDHVGAVVTEVLSGGRFRSIEGNSSDHGSQSNGGAVVEKIRQTSQTLGFYWPDYGSAKGAPSVPMQAGVLSKLNPLKKEPDVPISDADAIKIADVVVNRYGSRVDGRILNGPQTDEVILARLDALTKLVQAQAGDIAALKSRVGA